MSVPAKLSLNEVAESVLIRGDLSMLSEANRAAYYMRVCDSMGLNPLTRPFRYLKLNGALQLYATKDCTDQLRKIHSISVALVSQEVLNDIMIVHARASTAGAQRTDEDVGTVAFSDKLVGEARANAIMKCVTKAKRRVTLSICGLGMLDESEIDDTPGAERVPDKPAPNVLRSPPQSAPPLAAGDAPGLTAPGAAPATPLGDGAGALLAMATEAARRGEDVFQVFYKNRTPDEQEALKAHRTELYQLMGKEAP